MRGVAIALALGLGACLTHERGEAEAEAGTHVGRPAVACLTQGGAIHYAIAQTTEDGRACLVLVLTVGDFPSHGDAIRIDVPDGYGFEWLWRYTGACDVERVRAPVYRQSHSNP